jgi:O-antigen/teichoic acid export membrane protein
MSRAYSIAKLRRALLHFVGGRAVQAVARGALVLLVVRLLPTADYGAYMLIVGISEMLLQLCSLGILPVGQRFLPQLVESATRRDTYRFLATITSLQMLTLALVSGLFWWFWADVLPYMNFTAEQIERTRPAVLLFLLMPAFRFLVELLQALLEQGKAQIVASLVVLARITGIAVLLGAGAEINLERIVLLDSGVTLACLVLAAVLLIRSMRQLEEPANPQPLPVRDMARHVWHMSAVQLMGTAHTPGALRIVIANSLGIVETGLFAFLQSLQRLVGRYLPGELLRGLVRPMLISRSHANGGIDRRLEHGVGLLFKTNLIMVAGGAVAVLIAGDELVALASGGKFSGAGDALLLMVLVLAFTSQRMIVDMLMQILDLTRVLRVAAMLLPLTLLAVWLCADYGLNAAIAASATGVAVANTFCLWRLRVRTGRFGIDWWGTGSIVLTTLLAGLFGHGVRGLLGPWLAVVAAGALFAGVLIAAKPFAAGELQIVGRVLGNPARRAMQPLARKVPA